jgi:hypothetical protein
MITKYLLRLDSDLYQLLQDKAEEESRSVNSLITYIIKEYLKK